MTRQEQALTDEPADLATEMASAATARRGGPAGAPLRPVQPPGVAAVLAALRRRRLPLLACIVLVPLLAAVALHQVTPLYTATGTVLYDDSGYAARELQSVMRVDPMTDAVMASQAEILRGLSIAERISDRLGLDRDPGFNAALRPPGALARAIAAARRLAGRLLQPIAPDLAQQLLAPRPPDPAAERRNTLLAVQDAIAVATVKASRVLDVSFTGREPEQAARAVDLAMRLYAQDQLDAKIAAVHRATDWLDQRVAELRAQVRQAEGRIAAYRAAHGLSQGVRAGLDTERISQLNEDLLNSRNELAAAQARLDAARGAAGPAAQAAIAPSVVQARAQRDLLAGQLQARAVNAGADNPDLAALRAHLAAADRAVAAETARVAAADGAALRIARDRVAALQDALRRAQDQQDRSDADQVALNAMQRDADAARALLQQVQEREQQTAQQTAIETADARIISRALPPAEPSYPRRGPLLAAAAAFGVLFGLLLVHLLELSDGTFRSGEDVRTRLGLRCLALIPEIGRRTLGRRRLFDYPLDKPLSPYAEQIRALRAGLWLGRARPRIVAFTAARPSEGKTSVTLALARCAALCGERVAVIDCDLRQPSIGRMLGLDGGPGLIDCLQGRADLGDVLRHDQATGLAVMPAGELHTDGMAVFQSGAMAALLQRLRREYDLVLLDAPPAHAMTDARIVAGLAEATVLCLRWRSTPLGVVRDALNLLEEAQASVAGVALTRVDVRAHVRSGYADAEVYHPRYGGYFRE
jgi:capsular exopolysaccharide synthesis family protein